MSHPKTIINSNGSKWAGQSPDPIEKLLEVLAVEPLDRTFEAYGNFSYPADCGYTAFFGNFFKLSHAFNIYTRDPAVIEALGAAINANKQRPDYLSQETEAERKATLGIA